MLELNTLKELAYGGANQTIGVIELTLTAIKRQRIEVEQACAWVNRTHDDFVVSRSSRGRFHTENTRAFIDAVGKGKIRDHILVIKQEIQTPARMQAFEIIKEMFPNAVFIYADMPTLIKPEKPVVATVPDETAPQESQGTTYKTIEDRVTAFSQKDNELKLYKAKKLVEAHKARVAARSGVKVEKPTKPAKVKKPKEKKLFESVFTEQLEQTPVAPDSQVLPAPMNEEPVADTLDIKPRNKSDRLAITDFTVTELVKHAGVLVLGVLHVSEHGQTKNWLLQSAAVNIGDDHSLFLITPLNIHPCALTDFTSMETAHDNVAIKIQMRDDEYETTHITVLGTVDLTSERDWVGNVSTQIHIDFASQRVAAPRRERTW